jgi:hypothetical protein
MAKITITIEDSAFGEKVKCVAEPSVETMLQKLNSGNELSSAEAYALYMLRMVREESKRQSATKVFVPRVLRP